MGMYSVVSGEIYTSRELTSKEENTATGRAQAIAQADDSLYASGATIRHSAEPFEELRAYHLKDELQAIVDSTGEDVTFEGYIERAGREGDPTDIERLYIVGRKVVSVMARIEFDIPKGAVA